MKEGYIVANLTNYGDGFEIFGVYKSRENAVKQFRKVIRTRYGSCPRDLSKLYKPGQPNALDSGDSYQIIKFKENEGEW
jgi:hypothetical protein